MHSYCIQEEKWEGITFDLRLIHATCLSFAEKDIKAVIRWEQKPCSQSSPKTTAPGSTTSDGPGTPSPECQGSMAGALLDRSPLFLQFAAVWGGLGLLTRCVCLVRHTVSSVRPLWDCHKRLL